MGSVSEQHIEGLAGAAQRDVYEKLARLCLLRSKKTYSENQIAQMAGFGSVDAMYTQLGNWGLAGLLPKQSQGSSQQPKQRRAKSHTRDHTQDAGMKLPRPVAAVPLFEEAVDALNRIIEDLEHYRLVRKDGRFINTWVDNETPTYFPRSSFTPEQWKELCETYAHDTNSKGFWLSDAGMKDPTGGGRYPPRPLVNLIAVYALLERDMRALLQALHPDPSSVDGTRISGLLYKNKHDHDRDGLVRTAEQLAELVCGGDGRRGAPVGHLSAREQNVACSITEYREQGWSDKQICEYYVALGFSRERVLELGKLGLRWPEH